MTLLGPDGEQQRSFTAWLCWCSDDPWAVTVTFGTGRDATRWLVGLELLVSGCMGPAGLGDVSLLPALNVPALDMPDGDRPGTGVGELVGVVELVLSSPSGRAGFRLPVADLGEVLDRFLRARDLAECTLSCPDVDAELDRLIAEARAGGGENR